MGKRSERGEASIGSPVVVASLLLLCLAGEGVIVAAVVRHIRGVTVRDATAMAVAVVVVLVCLSVAYEAITRAETRRAPRPFEWKRPQRHESVTLELASGAAVAFDGVDVEADASMSPREATALREAWQRARPDRLPSPLDAEARGRWASLGLGLSGRSLTGWLRDLDRIEQDLAEWDPGDGPSEKFLFEYAHTALWVPAEWWVALGHVPTPEAMGELLEAGVADGGDALSWSKALGHRARPDEIRALRSAGWERGYDVASWAATFGRVPELGECMPLLAAGVRGWEAEQWAKAMGTTPTVGAIEALQRAGVQRGYEALWWSETIGVAVTPEAVRPWQEAGVRDVEDLIDWRWAVAGVSPAAIRQLRGAGVRDGADAVCWRKALGENPTPERVGALMDQGVRSGKDAHRHLAPESSGRG